MLIDRGSCFTADAFERACRALGVEHRQTKPYTPRTNGKAERFIRTMLREWAYAIPFRNADSRAADLPRWLAWYNHQRPHAALGGSPPVSRLPAPA